MSLEDTKTILFMDEADKSKIVIINQRKLPTQLEYIECNSYKRLAQSISSMEIRGAPAIGVAAAMGLALAARHSKAEQRNGLYHDLEKAADIIRTTRPTAHNLFWAVNRILEKAYSTTGRLEEVKSAVVDEAIRMAEEDIQINRSIGEYGAALLEDGDTVATICNAGWLATAGVYGTALGAIKVAHEKGKAISVIALETRPVLQGARLTSFELQQDGIEVTVITDSMVGQCLYEGMIDKFICGADRIVVSSGGHVINKVGTYTAAVAANHHGVPFYVAAPISTFDLESRLKDVTIEERDPCEVTQIGSHRIIPFGVPVLNPAFDITPPELINAMVTEKGTIYPPFRANINRIISRMR